MRTAALISLDSFQSKLIINWEGTQAQSYSSVELELSPKIDTFVEDHEELVLRCLTEIVENHVRVLWHPLDSIVARIPTILEKASEISHLDDDSLELNIKLIYTLEDASNLNNCIALYNQSVDLIKHSGTPIKEIKHSVFFDPENRTPTLASYVHVDAPVDTVLELDSKLSSLVINSEVRYPSEYIVMISSID